MSHVKKFYPSKVEMSKDLGKKQHLFIWVRVYILNLIRCVVTDKTLANANTY